MRRPIVVVLASLAIVPVGAGVAVAGGPAAASSVGVAKATQSAGNSKILCLPSGSSKRKGKVAPTACTTLGPKDSFAEALSLKNLKWSGWGKSKATATGIEVGFKEPASKISVKVTVSAPKANNCGGFSYTKISSTSKYGTTTQKLPAKCSD